MEEDAEYAENLPNLLHERPQVPTTDSVKGCYRDVVSHEHQLNDMLVSSKMWFGPEAAC